MKWHFQPLKHVQHGVQMAPGNLAYSHSWEEEAHHYCFVQSSYTFDIRSILDDGLRSAVT
jgi:hypothetical protein